MRVGSCCLPSVCLLLGRFWGSRRGHSCITRSARTISSATYSLRECAGGWCEVGERLLVRDHLYQFFGQMHVGTRASRIPPGQ